MKIKVLVVDDSIFMRKMICKILSKDDDFKLCITANNGKELVRLVSLKRPKVVITDIRMPIMDGIEATKIIKKNHPEIKVLAMTMFDQPDAIKQMLDAGASGYLLKNSGIKMLSKAIVAVSNGKTFFDPNVAFNFMNDYLDKNVTIGKSEKVLLSNREKEILQLIANGKTSKEIADTLFLAKTTIDTHRKNILRKLNLSSSTELLRYAIDTKYEF